MPNAFIFFQSRKRSKNIFLTLFLLLTSIIILCVIFFSWKSYNVIQKINIENNEQKETSYLGSFEKMVKSVLNSEYSKLSGEEEGRINLLLLGVAGENWPGKNLTDTIMIVSIDTINHKVGLLSLPRDMYVNIADTNYFTKINQIYQYGLKNNEEIKPIKDTVESITDLKIHYFFVIDFEGFKKIIDSIGGINIIVEKDIYDNKYPGPNYSYEIFEIKKGLKKMDGETALKYARVRHSDNEGDFGRAKRQQQIIQAAKNRIFSMETLLNPVALNNLLNTLEEHVKTNVTAYEIKSFIVLLKKLDTENINNVVIDAWKKDSLLKGSRLTIGNSQAYILVPRAGNWNEIKDLAENLFNMDIIQKRAIEIEKEAAKVAVINQSQNTKLLFKIRDLVKNELKIKNTVALHYKTRSTISESIIIDNSDKQKIYTLDELIKKIPARLDNNFNGILKLKDEDRNKYDLILILGNDLIEKHSFEEVSQEEFTKNQNNQEEFEIIEK